MKKLFLALALCLGMIPMTGCYAEEEVYAAPPPSVYTVGTVEFCDDYGCRWVTAPYYYVGDEVVYYDAYYGAWIGPRGWFVGGVWHRGWIPGYHTVYHGGYYHGWHGGWHGGGGYHGGYHGGGGHHR